MDRERPRQPRGRVHFLNSGENARKQAANPRCTRQVSGVHDAPPELHDGVLIERAVERDHDAQAVLYRRHADAVQRHLLALTGDRRLVEDLLQDVFVTAFSCLAQFDPGRNLPAWLHGIALQHVRNHRRKHHRRATLWSRFTSSPPAVSPSLDAIAEEAELVARLYRALDELNDQRREALVLRVVELLSLEDAAERMAVPPKTLSRWARTAEQHVRRRQEEPA